MFGIDNVDVEETFRNQKDCLEMFVLKVTALHKTDHVHVHAHA